MSTLILSGWTQAAGALATLDADSFVFDYSDYSSPEAAIEALSKFKPTHAVGWSMGGQLALRAIAADAIAPKHLTLIGSSCRFVGENGMGPTTFDLFRTSYANDTERTTTRFNALTAKGDSDFKQVMQRLEAHPHMLDTMRWLPWLDDLGRYDMHNVNLAKAPPTLIIHGMNDAIAPFAQSAMLAALLPNATVNGWEDTSHAPQAHDVVRLRAEIATHRQQHGVA